MSQSVSEARLRANRQNAHKSTGPRTPEGKAVSSLNALKHGLLAKRFVATRGVDPEDPDEFLELLDGLIADFQPVGFFESMLVERLASAFWRLHRSARFETRCIDLLNHPDHESSIRSYKLFFGGSERERCHIDLPTDNDIDVLLRYEAHIHRELQRTFLLLQHLQAARHFSAGDQVENDANPVSLCPDPPDAAIRTSQADSDSLESPSPQPISPIEPQEAELPNEAT